MQEPQPGSTWGAPSHPRPGRPLAGIGSAPAQSLQCPRGLRGGRWLARSLAVGGGAHQAANSCFRKAAGRGAVTQRRGTGPPEVGDPSSSQQEGADRGPAPAGRTPGGSDGRRPGTCSHPAPRGGRPPAPSPRDTQDGALRGPHAPPRPPQWTGGEGRRTAQGARPRRQARRAALRTACPLGAGLHVPGGPLCPQACRRSRSGLMPSKSSVPGAVTSRSPAGCYGNAP